MGRSTVLVVTPRFPLPRRSGTQIREYYSIRGLANRFDVVLLSLTQVEPDTEHVEEMSNVCFEVQTVPHSRTKKEALLRYVVSGKPYRVTKFGIPELERRCKSLVSNRDFDLIWTHFLSTMAVIPNTDIPVVLDQHNADKRYWESFETGDITERLFSKSNQRRLKAYRSSAIANVDAVLSVSEEDAQRTRQWVGNTPVWTVPNGVDTTKFTSNRLPEETDDMVRFVGSLDVRMNTDAIRWFVNEVWPSVHDRRPNATFEVVGRNPTEEIRKLEEIPGVRIQGEVDSVVPCYDSSSLTVAPFQFGGGSKLKVLESLSMRRPVVSTSTGSVGLDVTSDVGVIIREDAEEFANAAVNLLERPSKRARLGDAGRKFVREHYSWSEIMANGIDVVEASLLD